MDIVRLDLHLLDPVEQTAPVVQQCVRDDTCAEREGDQVAHGVGGREV